MDMPVDSVLENESQGRSGSPAPGDMPPALLSSTASPAPDRRSSDEKKTEPTAGQISARPPTNPTRPELGLGLVLACVRNLSGGVV